MIAAFVALLAAVPAQGPPVRPAAPPALTTLADGLAQARRRQQPVFVRVGAAWCPWCRKLDGEMRDPALHDELSRWVLVALDADRDAAAARSLGVSGIPALRLLTPAGRVVASSDGYMPADKLLPWLRDHYEAATGAVAEELTDDAPPTAANLTRLVAALGQRDPTLREAAVRRLLPHPEFAAAPVAEALARGPLQARLAALDLLHEWKAPVSDLDPWRPETLSADRLKVLRDWAAHAKPRTATAPTPLTPEQLADARRDLDRLLQGSDADAATVRERLARFGPALLPEVYARLKQPPTDQARERLTALRYRLVAADSLVLNWPGGLERLASADAAGRRQAVQELVARATPTDAPLLLELFSSPDPLVRELSLKALQSVGGSGAALAPLLKDPEPNVRAAVLKQLAEQPAADLVPRLTEYAATEPDPDLVVHAVRALRAVPGTAPLEGLKKLTGHASWRVRAEAVQALGEYLAQHRYGVAAGPTATDAREALIAALADPDGFVVGRAVAALSKANQDVGAEPLIKAARAHPELAPEIITALCHGPNHQAAVPHLRDFCKDARPAVRAAALRGLCQATPDGLEADLRAGLADPSSEVRTAAGNAFFDLLNAPEPKRAPGAGEEMDLAAAALAWLTGPDPDAAVARARSGKGRPAWMANLAAPLTPLLRAAAPEERLAGALPLLALGRDEARPVVPEAAKAAPALRGRAGEALPWLPWAQRRELFAQLLALKPDVEQFEEIVQQLTKVRDQRALPLLWELAARPDTPAEAAGALQGGLNQLLLPHLREISEFGQQRKVSDADRKAVLAAARPRAEAGPPLQRLVALALLVETTPDEAGALAARFLADDQAPAKFRGAAFQIRLICLGRAERRAAAVAALSHPLAGVRTLALSVLIEDNRYQLIWMTDWHIYFSPMNLDLAESSPVGDAKPFVPQPPPGLQPDHLRPLLTDPDPATAASAGYLLTQLQQPDGLPPLLRYWRESERTDAHWVRLVCRAITALGDDGQVRILDEIYRGCLSDGFPVREFYWTIRGLDGPNALKLRKQIRKDVGREILGFQEMPGRAIP